MCYVTSTESYVLLCRQLAVGTGVRQGSCLSLAIFTARSSYASAVLGIVILSVCMPVRPSVTRVLCDERKQHTAEIWIPHERVINLVFRCQKRLMGVVPFHLKFALKLTHPPMKNADFDQYLLVTSQQ